MQQNIYRMESLRIRTYLINKLNESHSFWSYDNNSISNIPDDILVELVMIHLDIEEIDLLFVLFPYEKVKGLWLDNVVSQGEMYFNLNYFLAWYYFHVKQPRKYVKEMFTKRLHKKLLV